MILTLLTLCILLQVADGITTYIGLTSENCQELNKVMSWLFEKVGLLPSIILANGIMISIVILVYVFSLPYITYIYFILITMYLIIFFNNLREIAK